MKYLDATFDDPASHLACDEALLELLESEAFGDGLLRIWESREYFVVLGHANSWNAEVNAVACAASGIPILRRMSGGGTVMQGPGCLNYALILNSAAHRLRTIGDAFRYVLERHRGVIAALIGAESRIDGISDLTISGRKFSGNAQYRKSRSVLVHGTFLLNFDFSLIDRCLHLPTKQPSYRRERGHSEFLVNLNLTPEAMGDALRKAWQATEVYSQAPTTRIKTLVRDRYGREEWSRKF